MFSKTVRLLAWLKTASMAGLVWGGLHGTVLAQEVKALSVPEITAKGGVLLTGPQITSLLVGNTAVSIRLVSAAKVPKGSSVVLFFRDSKTRVFRTQDGRLIEATTWVEGTETCSEYKVEKIGHVCGTNYRLGSEFYFCERNTAVCEWTFRILPGNPHNL